MLGRKFASGAGAMWEALPSQIYPELRRLEKLGWIEGKTSPRDKLRRRVYRVTALGKRELQNWVAGDESEHPAERDAERVRFLFIDRSDIAVIRRHLHRHLAHYAQRLEQWRAHRDAIVEGKQERMLDRLAECPEEEKAFVTTIKCFAFEGLVRHAEMEVSWAQEILAWLDKVKGKKNVKVLPFQAPAARGRRTAGAPQCQRKKRR
jgi:PadR family transcriptional regulator, regulatory protein AphA